MKRIIVICEGHTEKEFCQKILQPHLLKFDKHTQAPLIKKSGGGIVKWQILKNQIEGHLREQEAIVTTFIDFYGIKDKHYFPLWEESKSIFDKNERMNFLEKAMLNEIGQTHPPRLIPYIQLHEFEGLLFNSMDVFERQFEEAELTDKQELEQILQDFPNPELINDNPDTAPSKRLAGLIDGYHKIVYGIILAEDIGLENIRAKSPRFNHWIEKLESI